MSAECQELNALYSLAVDGGSVKIPDRLKTLPPATTTEPYVLDQLHAAAQRFAEEFHQIGGEAASSDAIDSDVASEMLTRLLATESATMSEYELVCKAMAIARKHEIDFTRFLSHVDFSAMTTAEKYILSAVLELKEEDHPYIWNR